jgi:hypothetical protein
MTETEDTGEGLAELKGKRRNPPKTPARRPSVLVAASKAVSTGSPVADAMQRKEVLLFDPGEIQAVVPASAFGGEMPKLDDLYDVAESTFDEAIVPDGCKTAISVRRWTKGDLVRKDIYAAWRTLEAAKVAAAEAKTAATG